MGLTLADARVLVTGGAGFLGRAVVARLQAAGCASSWSPRRAQYDLTRERRRRARSSPSTRSTLVLHLAADVGGIGVQPRQPGPIFYANLMMGALVMEHARRAGVRKFVGVGSVCAYPKHTPVPFREDDLWDGYPEETNGAYGSAKKMLLVQGQAYRAAVRLQRHPPADDEPLRPRRQLRARRAPRDPRADPPLRGRRREPGRRRSSCWGDGLATREFLYVDDAAAASCWPPSAMTTPRR